MYIAIQGRLLMRFRSVFGRKNSRQIPLPQKDETLSTWLFTLKKPKSERFTQISFKGFGPHGSNWLEKALRTFMRFIKALFRYLIKKIKRLTFALTRAFLLLGKYSAALKQILVQKLIWSRGRLGRPVTNFIIITVAFFVFLFGEIFNSSKFVNSQEIDPDYLANITDIIPQRNTATTLIPEARKRTEPLKYRVVGGDTLSGIGNKFKISVDALKYVNGLTDNSILKVGQEVTIPPLSGLIHKVEEGDNIESIANKYDVPSQAIADFNYILDTSKLVVGTELVVPDAKVPQPKIVPIIPSQFIPSVGTDPDPGTGWCMWPTTVRIITQYFSWYHNGIDIATPWGMSPPLYACSSGVVARAGWDPWGLGLHVVIDHGNGYSSVYGHMDRIDVGYGQEVSRGETIGVMGNTGRSTGPHVHFILRFNGVPQDPLNYIN